MDKYKELVDELRRWGGEDMGENLFDRAADAIEELLNVSEIVRCRDCKNYDLSQNGVNGSCNRQYATFYSWDFCSYGERKGEEE